MTTPARRRPGRPPLADHDTTTPVCVKLPSAEFDRTCSRASRDRVSVPTIIRRALARLLDDDERDDE